MSGTYPNKIYQHAGQTDRLENSLTLSTLPTIWDRLADHSLSGKYYFSDIPFTALWGLKYLHLTHHVSEFFEDCAAGTLPHVSMVDPRFLLAAQGLSADDHPHADIRNGQVFLNDIYRAVTTSPNWLVRAPGRFCRWCLANHFNLSSRASWPAHLKRLK